MAVFKSFRGLLYVKRRPGKYDSDGMTVGGKAGIVLAKYPSEYPKTAQQKKIGEAAKACGIKSGISRSELRHKMKECIPGKF
jgi:hypothetical protein